MQEVLTVKGKNPEPGFIKLITGAPVPPEPDETITVLCPEDLEDQIIDRLGLDVWNYIKPWFRQAEPQEESEGELTEADCCYEEIREKDVVLTETLDGLQKLKTWLTERKRWQRESVFEQVDAMTARVGNFIKIDPEEEN